MPCLGCLNSPAKLELQLGEAAPAPASMKWGQVEEQRGKIPTADCSLGLPPKEERQCDGSVDLTMLAMTVAVIERGQVKVDPRQGKTKAWHTQHVQGVGEECSRVGEECRKRAQEWGKNVQFHFNGSANSEVRPASFPPSGYT